MSTKPKISINDVPELRAELTHLVENADQVTLCKWAIIIARRVLPYLDAEFPDCVVIRDGFAIQEQRQLGLVRMHDVRQAGFKIHALARRCRTETARNAARAAGQAVGVGHMKEHALVCSDYAIKAINSDPERDIEDVRLERGFQIAELLKFIRKT